MAGAFFPSLPGIPAAAPVPQKLAPEASGKIGALATFYGVGTKEDGEVDAPIDVRFFPADDRLLPVPEQLGEGWTDEIVQRTRAAIDRVIALGDFSTANRWTALMGKTRSEYFHIDAIERMTTGMERTAAAKAQALKPVEPAVIYTRLAEVGAISDAGGAAYDADHLPIAIVGPLLEAINGRLRALAQAGFRHRSETGIHAAPAEIRQLATDVSRMSGAAVRVINQIGHLLTVSRKGQSAHIPMTLDRRLLLVDSALAQLAEDIGVPVWTAATLGLVTDELRRAWRAREAAEPLRERFPRNLFDWATPPTRHPLALADAEILHEIQSHPDMAFVETLRIERARRGL